MMRWQTRVKTQGIATKVDNLISFLWKFQQDNGIVDTTLIKILNNERKFFFNSQL